MEEKLDEQLIHSWTSSAGSKTNISGIINKRPFRSVLKTSANPFVPGVTVSRETSSRIYNRSYIRVKTIPGTVCSSLFELIGQVPSKLSLVETKSEGKVFSKLISQRRYISPPQENKLYAGARRLNAKRKFQHKREDDITGVTTRFAV